MKHLFVQRWRYIRAPSGVPCRIRNTAPGIQYEALPSPELTAQNNARLSISANAARRQRLLAVQEHKNLSSPLPRKPTP